MPLDREEDRSHASSLRRSLGRPAVALRGAISLALALGLSGCATVQAVNPVPAPSDAASLDTWLGESLWPDEATATAQMAADIGATLRTRYPPGTLARRDAHAKAHGCVRATFRVAEDLAPNLAVGLFVPGRSYEAIVRFSNGNGDATRADAKGDARGMAIKLLGVPGEKLLSTEHDAGTQDFILINTPIFFAADPSRYQRLITRASSGNPLVQVTAPLALGWRGLWIARKIAASTIASPLDARYWSTVPYRLGLGLDRVAVKYSARPCVPVTSTIPTDPGPNYLREAMARRLATTSACFEFLVQVRSGPHMSVEDPRDEWSESEAPFVRVATIDIPAQDFSTPSQDATCEALSFTPWHTVSEHRPLGGMNRARRVVYEAVSALRHDLNGAPRVEPVAVP